MLIHCIAKVSGHSIYILPSGHSLYCDGGNTFPSCPSTQMLPHTSTYEMALPRVFEVWALASKVLSHHLLRGYENTDLSISPLGGTICREGGSLWWPSGQEGQAMSWACCPEWLPPRKHLSPFMAELLLN